MRFVLFYSTVESFNYFTDRIVEELIKRNYECFILDLTNSTQDGSHSFKAFTEFLSVRADAAIGFDGIGLKDDMFIELWDSMDTVALNILMDHPLRFHPTMQKHPRNYVQFCCDDNHVDYVKKYFGDTVGRVEFMPHAGTYNGKLNLEGYDKRPYDVLFSGTYYRPQSYLEQIDNTFKDNELLRVFYHNLAEYMIDNNSITTEQAVLDVIDMMELSLAQEQVKQLFRFSEPIDWLARMYYREKIISIIAEAGIDIWLLGRGWENHPSANLSNVHIINDRVPFARTLPVMAEAKINLNVMPWFKAGTHDRIFNILLSGSLPLTDSSKWLKEHFQDKKDIVYYKLDACEEIPQLIKHYMDNSDEAKAIIQNGFDIVADNYVWGNIVEQLIRNV